MKLSATKQTSIASISRKVWTPADNFKNGEQGFWLDPTSFSNIYQDSAGTSPATAVEQPAGLVLDRRLGLVRGAELVANGAFDTAAGWTFNAGAVWAGGVAVFSSGGDVIQPGIGVASGTICAIRFDIVTTLTGTLTVYLGGAPAATYAAGSIGTKTLTFSKAAFNSNLQFHVSAGGAGAIDNASVTSIPGNHFSQVSAPARPIIKILDGVQCHSIDGLDDTIATSPATFGASMDIILAVRRTSTTGALLFATAGGAQHVGAMDATAGPASSGAGTPAYLVNDVVVPGGTATTRAQLAAAVPVGAWCVVEILGADLSAWTAAAIGAYAALPLGMGFAQGIAYPSGDTAARARNRRFAGQKVGLTL